MRASLVSWNFWNNNGDICPLAHPDPRIGNFLQRTARVESSGAESPLSVSPASIDCGRAPHNYVQPAFDPRAFGAW